MLKVATRTSPASSSTGAALQQLLYSLEDTSRVLGVSVSTVRRLTRAGELKALKVLGSTRWAHSELEAFVARLSAGQQP